MKSRLFKLSLSFTMLLAVCAMGADKGKEKKEEKPSQSDNSKTATQPAKPPRIVVVVSKKNPIKSLTMEELKRIYLRKKLKWPNRWSITVYQRHTDNPIRQEFSERVLKKKPKELNEYWINLILTRGIKRPKACRSAKLVAQHIKRVKGGIGYMYEHEVDKKLLKIVEIKGPENEQRASEE